MADTAVATDVTRPGPRAEPSWRRPVIGIAVTAALLTPLTVLLTNVDFGIWREPMLYLLAVGIATAIGGVSAAIVAAIAATVIVDYFFTYPLYTLSPLAPDMLIFIGATLGVVALITVGARKVTRARDVTAAVDAALRDAGGASRWAAVYSTTEGREYAIWPPGQDLRVTAQQLADGVHGITCDNCPQCHSQVV